MTPETLSSLIPAFCAAISVFALALLLGALTQNIELEKTEKTSDYKKIPLFLRIFMPLAPNLFPLLRHESMQDTVRKAQEKLGMAGYDTALNGMQFVALRILTAFFGMILAILCFIAGEPAAGLLLLLILLLYPGAWLNGRIRKRHLEILKALPNVLDLLTLSVAAGKDFLSSLRDIVMRRRPDAVGEVMSRALHEIQLGKPRQQALREMSQRVRQSDLTTVLNAIIQADELGVSIGQILQVQSEQLRAKRFSRAEKMAAEAPVKILLPIILFIFPSVFIILMGPLLSQALRSFGF